MPYRHFTRFSLLSPGDLEDRRSDDTLVGGDECNHNEQAIIDQHWKKTGLQKNPELVGVSLAMISVPNHFEIHFKFSWWSIMNKPSVSADFSEWCPLLSIIGLCFLTHHGPVLTLMTYEPGTNQYLSVPCCCFITNQAHLHPTQPPTIQSPWGLWKAARNWGWSRAPRKLPEIVGSKKKTSECMVSCGYFDYLDIQIQACSWYVKQWLMLVWIFWLAASFQHLLKFRVILLIPLLHLLLHWLTSLPTSSAIYRLPSIVRHKVFTW